MPMRGFEPGCVAKTRKHFEHEWSSQSFLSDLSKQLGNQCNLAFHISSFHSL